MMKKMLSTKTKKSPAQLNRDIAESLSGKRSGNARTVPSTKKDFDWDAFASGAALGFWASPYMSEVENLYEDSREAESAGDTGRATALKAAHKALSPGPGGAWESVMDDPPPSARAVGKKFTKAARAKLKAAELDEIFNKFSAHDAGYYGAMQSLGEGVGWFDEGVRADPPRGFDWDTKLHNDIYTAIGRKAREAGIKMPRR